MKFERLPSRFIGHTTKCWSLIPGHYFSFHIHTLRKLWPSSSITTTSFHQVRAAHWGARSRTHGPESLTGIVSSMSCMLTGHCISVWGRLGKCKTPSWVRCEDLKSCRWTLQYGYARMIRRGRYFHLENTAGTCGIETDIGGRWDDELYEKGMKTYHMTRRQGWIWIIN